MADVLITIAQALQLVALAPCLFVVVFLICSAKKTHNIVPILYFISLGCSFVVPLLPLFGPPEELRVLRSTMIIGNSLGVAFSFLLITQFLLGRIPPLVYWLVLAIPMIGGAPLIYAAFYDVSFCVRPDICLEVDAIKTLYDIFGSSLVFLLLMLHFARYSAHISEDDLDRGHKYWLVIALIGLNLMLLGLDLARIAGALQPSDFTFATTMIRIAFIYLVLTSVFRVFYELFDMMLISSEDRESGKNDDLDRELANRIADVMTHERLYREMAMTREKLAQRVGISEYQLSRVINNQLAKNYNEFVNGYRVEEAKGRLAKEPDTSITVIAFEVGFNSIASFNRVFKAMTGKSPTEFRSALQEPPSAGPLPAPSSPL